MCLATAGDDDDHLYVNWWDAPSNPDAWHKHHVSRQPHFSAPTFCALAHKQDSMSILPLPQTCTMHGLAAVAAFLFLPACRTQGTSIKCGPALLAPGLHAPTGHDCASTASSLHCAALRKILQTLTSIMPVCCSSHGQRLASGALSLALPSAVARRRRPRLVPKVHTGPQGASKARVLQIVV
jgi:hypothetical protein